MEEITKPKNNNNRIIWIIIGVIVLVMTVATFLFFSQKNSDETLMNDLQQQISDIETTNMEEETADTQITGEINEVTGSDLEALDDLEVQFNTLMEALDQMESAESNLDSAAQ